VQLAANDRIAMHVLPRAPADLATSLPSRS
jgi:hypothetical protein